ncbi:leucine-rich repeat-containing protein 71-like [Babylonia areolata]|uniref:leucine-rich repeat-containing protein 71-like n=1 Tax=Babylonia areolata TaxID=304850 RepID=UPI003FCF3D54
MSTTGDSACLSTTGNSASQSISGDSAGSLSTHTVFLTSERSALDYFKPRIQVEQEDWQDDSTVTAVHISGWRVDTAMMSVLQVCWSGLAMLRCLRLTNVGLTGDAFTRMASSVAHCPCLTWLVLDQNPLAHAPLSALLRNRNTPWHLSLRFCGLGDLDVLQLAQRLGMSVTGYTLTSHSIVEPADDGLVSLNLSGNEIGDAGAGHLADALKSNRSLLVLNLAGNRLGDIGVARLARTLAWFPLTADEEKMRRDSLTNDESTTVLGRPRSLSLKKRKSLREPKVRAARLLDTYDKLRYKPSWYRPGDDAVDLVGPHPFQQTGFLRDGSLWLPGNRALVSLNVSRNRVARAGVQALLGAVREQMLPSHDGLPGLRRLVIHRNPIPPDCGQLQELCHLMERRDPAFRCPTIDLRKAWIMPCALPLSALM